MMAFFWIKSIHIFSYYFNNFCRGSDSNILLIDDENFLNNFNNCIRPSKEEMYKTFAFSIAGKCKVELSKFLAKYIDKNNYNVCLFNNVMKKYRLSTYEYTIKKCLAECVINNNNDSMKNGINSYGIYKFDVIYNAQNIKNFKDIYLSIHLNLYDSLHFKRTKVSEKECENVDIIIVMEKMHLSSKYSNDIIYKFLDIIANRGYNLKNYKSKILKKWVFVIIIGKNNLKGRKAIKNSFKSKISRKYLLFLFETSLIACSDSFYMSICRSKNGNLNIKNKKTSYYTKKIISFNLLNSYNQNYKTYLEKSKLIKIVTWENNNRKSYLIALNNENSDKQKEKEDKNNYNYNISSLYITCAELDKFIFDCDKTGYFTMFSCFDEYKQKMISF